MQDPSVLTLRRGSAAAGLLLLAAGCVGGRIVHPIMPTDQELAEFQAAGQAPDKEVAPDFIMAMHVTAAAYHVTHGDLLEVEVPAEVVGVVEEGEPTDTVRSRVNRDGIIRLPLIGEIEVAGMTTSDIEQALVEAYYPAYLQQTPNIVVEVKEYRTASVAVMGAVQSPGIVSLRSDRMSLIGALMSAGGIREDPGAGTIRITRHDDPTDQLVLPVYGSNIPATDVPLEGGETIVVAPRTEAQFTVIGLVKRPGAYSYPSGRVYNLHQAIAVAGGTDEISAPRYAVIYRRTPAGKVIGATFKIDGLSLTDASNIEIKPGDVVSIDHTQGSWMRQFLSQVLGFRASYSLSSVQPATL